MFNWSHIAAGSSPAPSLVERIFAAMRGPCCWFVAAVLTHAAPASATRLGNLSSMMRVGPGEGASLNGLVIAGAEKSLLVRGIGPGLRQFGLTDPLPDPVLRILDRTGRELHRNAGWQLSPDAARLPRLAAEVGTFALAADSADTALLVRLAPGVYTLAIDSASQQTGTVLAEIFELDHTGTLANLATITCLTPTQPALFGTFRIDGCAPKKILVRAVGPGLCPLGVPAPLADPQLAIYNFAGAKLLARSEDWFAMSANDAAASETAAASCGAFPLEPGSKDAAVLVTLPPGTYTAQVTGKGNDTGLVLLEIYAVP